MEELAKEGRIHSHKEFFALTGREGGFMIIEGEVEELLRLAAEPEILAMNAKAAAIVQDFETQVYAGRLGPGDPGAHRQLRHQPQRDRLHGTAGR